MKKVKEEIAITEAPPCFRNYRPFPLFTVETEENTDLIEVTQGDTVILQKRSFHHLDGICASSYSLRSEIEDGVDLTPAPNQLPSKMSIVDKSTQFMNNFKISSSHE